MDAQSINPDTNLSPHTTHTVKSLFNLCYRVIVKNKISLDCVPVEVEERIAYYKSLKEMKEIKKPLNNDIKFKVARYPSIDERGKEELDTLDRKYRYHMAHVCEEIFEDGTTIQFFYHHSFRRKDKPSDKPLCCNFYGNILCWAVLRMWTAED